MEYRLRLAKRMLFNKKGSLIGAVLAVTIGILVIHVNFVIFQGLFDAIVRDISNYRNGDILVTDEADYIDKSDLALVNWFERIPFVQGATPRLSSSAEINMTKNGKLIEETRVPVLGVDPLRDVKASTAHETVAEGTYVLNRNSVVLGNNVATDLDNAQVGDSLKMLIVDRKGEDQIRRFTVAGIVKSPGGQGLDYSVVMHIDTLRDMMGRSGETGSFMVKLNDPTKAFEVKEFFLAAYPNDDFIAETIEESAEEQLAGFRSGIAMINLIGYFGMMSSAFYSDDACKWKNKRNWSYEINWCKTQGYSNHFYFPRDDYWRNRCWGRYSCWFRIHNLCQGDKDVIHEQHSLRSKLQLGENNSNCFVVIFISNHCISVSIVQSNKTITSGGDANCLKYLKLVICLKFTDTVKIK
jgi:lipoprotein-releasing system permease protein